jgi:hypothetical protein
LNVLKEAGIYTVVNDLLGKTGCVWDGGDQDGANGLAHASMGSIYISVGMIA